MGSTKTAGCEKGHADTVSESITAGNAKKRYFSQPEEICWEGKRGTVRPAGRRPALTDTVAGRETTFSCGKRGDGKEICWGGRRGAVRPAGGQAALADRSQGERENNFVR